MKNFWASLLVFLSIFGFGARAIAAYNPADVPTVSSIAAMQALGAAQGTSVSSVIVTNVQGASVTFNIAPCGSGFEPSCTPDNATTFAVGASAVPPYNSGYVWQRAFVQSVSVYNAGATNYPSTTTPTDSTAAIIAAVAAAQGSSASLSTAPARSKPVTCSGQLWVNNTIQLTNGVNLQGLGGVPVNCQINVSATSTGIQNAGVVQIGNGTTPAFWTMATGLTINMNAKSGMGLYIESGQDMTGCWGCFVYQVLDGPGISFDGSSGSASPQTVNTFQLQNTNVWASQSMTGGNTNPLIEFGASFYPGIVSGNDFLCFTTHCPTNGVYTHDELNVVQKWWTEEVTGASGPESGVIANNFNNDEAISLEGITASYFDTVVKATYTGSQNFYMNLRNIYANSATTMVNNASGFCGPAQTVTAASVGNSLGHYDCGPTGFENYTNLFVGPQITYNANALTFVPAVNTNPPNFILKPQTGATGGTLRAQFQLEDLSNNGWKIENIGDSGETLEFLKNVSNSYTDEMNLDTSGNLNLLNGAYEIGGTAGITETCSVTPTSLTITGGIITAKSGGTCTP